MVSGFLLNRLFEYSIVKSAFNESYHFLLKVLDRCCVSYLTLNVDKADA